MQTLLHIAGWFAAASFLAGCGTSCELECGSNGACVLDEAQEVGSCECFAGFSWDGGACCADGDADGACDEFDNCVDVPNADQADFNDDDLGDACDTIVIPIASLSTEAAFFTYDARRRTEVRYFAVLGADDYPHVAFDACDVCYHAGQGYRQEGDQMVCNNCGNAFGVEGIGTENTAGGCWPGYLEVEVTATDVRIEPETLEDGAWYFR